MSNRKKTTVRGRPSKYPPEFRRDAVAMVLDEDRPIADVGRAVGVNPGTLGNWVGLERIERGVRQGLTADDRADRGPDRTPRAAGQAVVVARRAERQDVGMAAEVYLRSRHAAVPAIPPLAHDDDSVRAWFADTVFAQRELWIAAQGSGAVIGIMVLDGVFVDQLYVNPGRTGAGIGSELLAVAQSLRPGGLQLWTFQSNEGARRFYERHGFTAVEWTDGAGNEERAPDVRYMWNPT